MDEPPGNLGFSPPVAAGITGAFTFCVSKVIPTGFTIGKFMSIITQGASPRSLSAGGANLSVFYYAVGGPLMPPGGATWVPPGVEITPIASLGPPPVVLQTDTELPFNPPGATPTSGTGSSTGASTLFIGMTFTIPSLLPVPDGVMGGYFDIIRV